MYTINVTPDQSLQQVLNQLPQEGEACVLLAAGTWHEKVELLRPNTILQGAGAGQTILTWQDGAFDYMEDIGKRGTFRTATLRTDGDHITLRDLTIENAASPREKVGQAIALYADGDCFTCEACELLSYQDTLFTAPLPPKEVEKNGFIGPKQYAPRKPQKHRYLRCTIKGDVDFIFGGAAAWFEGCDIVTRDGRESFSDPHCSYATAASTPEGQPYGYVFSNCRFLAEGCPPASVYLGRPWRAFAKTVLLHCELGEHIRPEGWHDWGKPDFHTCGLYGEYQNFGPGAVGERASFAHQLSDEEAADYTMERFMRSPL